MSEIEANLIDSINRLNEVIRLGPRTVQLPARDYRITQEDIDRAKETLIDLQSQLPKKKINMECVPWFLRIH